MGANLGSHTIKLAERVTVKKSIGSILHPEHEVLNYPIKSWKRFWRLGSGAWLVFLPVSGMPLILPILSCNSPGEDARDGGILIAKYGEGNFIYALATAGSVSCQRVVGAWDVANMVSLGKDIKTMKIQNWNKIYLALLIVNAAWWWYLSWLMESFCGMTIARWKIGWCWRVRWLHHYLFICM